MDMQFDQIFTISQDEVKKIVLDHVAAQTGLDPKAFKVDLQIRDSTPYGGIGDNGTPSSMKVVLTATNAPPSKLITGQ